MNKTLQEFQNELESKIKYSATLEERNRIMRELNKANLPLGFWPLIKDIINPPDEI